MNVPGRKMSAHKPVEDLLIENESFISQKYLFSEIDFAQEQALAEIIRESETFESSE